MPLYTSSSDPPIQFSLPSRLRPAICALLGAAVLIYAGGEAAAIVGLGHISTIHKRIMSEARHSEHIHSANPGKPKMLMMAGNSLLLHAIDFPRLAKGVTTKFQISR